MMNIGRIFDAITNPPKVDNNNIKNNATTDALTKSLDPQKDIDEVTGYNILGIG